MLADGKDREGVVSNNRDQHFLNICIDGSAFKTSVLITARKRSLGQGNIFTPVCHSVHRGGMHGCSWGGGHVWLLQGGMHGCSGGHAWLLPGGMHGCSWGAWDMTRYRDMINERAVRILLECILVRDTMRSHRLLKLIVFDTDKNCT